MRSLPTNVAESGSTIRWSFESWMESIEEFACNPEAFGPGGPGGEEVKERIRRYMITPPFTHRQAACCKGNTYPSQAQPTRDTGRRDGRVKLLPGGFAQLLPIVQWVVAVHLDHIEEAARGTLASETGGPSEEVALECLLRIFEERYEEADKETIEAYMRARTWKWWQDFPERRLLTDMVWRADQRKKKIGSEYSRRRPLFSEGLQIARLMLAGIPDKISLDSEGEYEAVSGLLAALLSPPMGEPSLERLQGYIELSKSIPVYRDALRLHYEELDNPTKTIFRPALRWQRRSAGRTRLRQAKIKVPAHSPVKPALLLRNFQIQFVIGLLERVGVRPRAKYVSGCGIVGEVIGRSPGRVKSIWEMRFTTAMSKHSKAVAERTGLLDTTEA